MSAPFASPSRPLRPVMPDPERAATPSNGPTLALLGAGALGGELAGAARRAGARVVALEGAEGAPSVEVADAAEIVDLADVRKLGDALGRHAPTLLLPASGAVAPDLLRTLEEGGVPSVPSADAIALTADREVIRRLADQDLGLRAPRYVVAGSEAEARAACEELGYPCVVKRVTGPSGRGQSVVTGPARVELAWEYALTGPRDRPGQVIVEELIEFDQEITMLAVRAADGTLQLADPIGARNERGSFRESWCPAEVEPTALAEAQDMTRRIADRLEEAAPRRTGLVAVQFFVTGGEVVFSEVSLGPHETAVVTLVGQELSQFDLHVRSALGRESNGPRLVGPAAAAAILARDEGRVTGYEGLDRAYRLEGVRILTFGRPRVRPTARVGMALASADTVDEARARALEAAGRIDVVMS